jgi:hypothetical protein
MWNKVQICANNEKRCGTRYRLAPTMKKDEEQGTDLRQQ